jgi:hypothetical protein
MLHYLISILIGFLSWNGNIYGLIAAPFLVLLWKNVSNKKQAYFIALSYYLAASYGLIKGAGVFFGNPITQELSIIAGLSIWIVPNLLLSLPWGMLWNNQGYLWRIPLILLIVSIPPIGLFGFANLITASGVLFPGSRWFGLIATIFLMITLCYPNKQILALTIITVFSLVLNLTYKEPAPPQGWVGVNTNIGWIKNSSDEYNHNKQLIEIISNLIGQDNIKVVLLPELVIGSWNEAIKNLWYKLAIKAKQRGITILLGGKQWMKEKEYTNGLITIGNEEDKLLINRVPVPISMWRPWSKTKAKAKSYWFDNGIYELAGKKVTTLICYEQLLVWPILHSMLYKPDIILASSNVWWAIDTNIPAILKEVVRAWGRLFGIPKLIARNK